jgi:hypothetical protein
VAQSGIILGLLVTLYTKDVKYILYSLVLLILTIVAHKQLQQGYVEKFDWATTSPAPTIVYPTVANPYMNIQLSDYLERPNRESANKTVSAMLDPNYAAKIREESNRAFYDGFFADAGDVYQRGSSARQFYTTPITTIPNDLDAYLTFVGGNK